MSDPTFTVLIPLYNKRDFIQRTITSVLGQSLVDFELLVVDDGSSDGSVELVAAIDDQRIRIISQENAGPSAARNFGFREARADWVALLDADDLWCADHLSELARVIASCPHADLVATSFRQTSAAGFELPAAETAPHPIREINYLRDALHGTTICSSNVAIRRTTFLQSGGFGPFCPGEDTELWARLSLDHIIAKSEAVTSFYVRSNNGIMDQEFANRQREPNYSPAPVIQTLSRALADPRYGEQQGDIITYMDRAHMSGAKQSIFSAHHDLARTHLMKVEKDRGARFWAFRLLSHLPPQVVQPLIRAASLLRTNRRLTRP